jgi:hypothetical protein
VRFTPFSVSFASLCDKRVAHGGSACEPSFFLMSLSRRSGGQRQKKRVRSFGLIMGGTGKDGRDQLMDMTGFMAHYHRGAGPARLAGRRI